MKLYLLRHAHALDGPNDPLRALSPKGNRIARKWAAFLPNSTLFEAELAWCSPYLRAQQTVEPIITAFDGKLKLKERVFLTPEDDPKLAANAIDKCSDSLLIVGHNPNLSLLAGQLLGFPPNEAFFHFKKAGMLVLEKHSKQAPFRMVAYLTPASLGWL